MSVQISTNNKEKFQTSPMPHSYNRNGRFKLEVIMSGHLSTVTTSHKNTAPRSTSLWWLGSLRFKVPYANTTCFIFFISGKWGYENALSTRVKQTKKKNKRLELLNKNSNRMQHMICLVTWSVSYTFAMITEQDCQKLAKN